MTNILNSIIANQSIKPSNQEVIPAFSFDSDGKTKPLEYKGKLLPSKIFTSPKEYMHDLKKDIVSLGKAAKGQANDHELGRINDFSMKLGALALASYLCIKNPLKFSKTMEFIGVGTFFGGMALWPKLLIQLPLKARTGVDIHQKYVDSQGRKKMLFQDPQYDLTDLYSREDLDRMGKKLNVNENLPDRDNFIKQRAKKVALQGNTLWMMSAFTTPIVSALSCKALEKPVDKLIEKIELVSSSLKLNALEQDAAQGPLKSLRNRFSQRAFDKFLEQHANTPMDDKFIAELVEKLSAGTNSASMKEAIKEEIKRMKPTATLTEELIRDAVREIIPANVLGNLTPEQNALLNKKISEGSIKGIADFISKLSVKNDELAQIKLSKNIGKAINKALETSVDKPLSQAAMARVKSLHSILQSFAENRSIIDNYIGKRVAQNAGTYNARQWNRVCDAFLKSLKLSDKELKQIADGNMSLLDKKLSELAKDNVQFNKTVKKLVDLITQYDNTTGKLPISNITISTHKVCKKTRDMLAAEDFHIVADKVAGKTKFAADTLEKTILSDAKGKISGEISSFYRLLQILDVYKQNIGQCNSLETKLKEALIEQGIEPSNEMLSRLAKTCKNIVNNATTADYIVKLREDGFRLSEKEYKAVMKTLFGPSDTIDGIEHIFREDMKYGEDIAKSLLQGFNRYKSDFMKTVVNCENNVTPQSARFVVDSAAKAADQGFAKQNEFIGSTLSNSIQEYAKKAYNTNKWLKMFGIGLAVVAAITLLAGLTFGKKSKVEKQAEKEIK